MARPASRRTQPRTAPPSPEALAELALGLFVEHGTAARAGEAWRFGPVVLVSPALQAASEAVRAALAARDVDPGAAATIRDGRELDAEIAAALADDRLARLVASFAARRLVVVDRFDAVTAPDRQQALVHLLDSSAAAGAAWCVSVAEYPPEGLLPQCRSRLGGGLVVPLPATAASGPAPAAGVSLARVIRAAARLHDLPPQVVVGAARNRTVAAARSLAMYLARTLTGRSLQAIGDACGGRDHTTVLHGVRVCAARIARDASFAADVGRLAAELAGEPGAPRRGAGGRRRGVGSAPLRRALANRRRQRRRPA